MIQPIKYKSREPLNSLTGIKSSLGKLRSVISLTYLLYLANDKKESVSYSIANGNTIVLKNEYIQYIKNYLNDSDLDNVLNDNPLLSSQIESLYVGITLMFALGKVSFENKSLPITCERTGGIRYPKVISYASNMIMLDLILSDIDDGQKKKFLKSWLKDEHLTNELELKISTFLNICIENNLFKLKNGEDDLFFQSEGIYLGLNEDGTVSLESDEKVGPARIFNSMLVEGLVPWLNVRRSEVSYNSDCSFNYDAYSKIVSTSLDIRDIKVDKNKPYNNTFTLFQPKYPLQQIFYGAPGTGKSYATNEVTSKYPDTVRTTFHPDSDYSTFVGAYKPTMEEVDVKTVPVVVSEGITLDQNKGSYKEKRIVYKFIKQAFLKAYVKAWKKFRDTYMDGVELTPQFLVIEEINRGNCAQIFGDLFQLLDRKENFSEYPIEADADICKALLDEDTDDNPSFGVEGLQLSKKQVEYINSVFDKEGEVSLRVAEKICKGQVLVLPPNFYIWATMNTSDQSLFPIDSAFKRRWEWKYVRISKGKDSDNHPLDFRIQFTTLDGEKVNVLWWDFLQAINAIIDNVTKSEDKKLGYFFCKPDKKADGAGENAENTIISAETFVGKVVFYLWQDVFKDYGFKSDIFKKDDGKRLSFHDFYPDNKEPDDKNPEAIDLNLVKRFIDRVMIKKPAETPAPPQAEDPIE